MIRRAFWLTVGAAGGIMGYRRVARLGRRVTGARVEAANRQGLVPGTIRATREARGFSRDVREGMDLYWARRSRRRALPSVQAQDTPVRARPNDNDVNEKDDR